MSLIAEELKRRHEFDAAWLTLDTKAVVAGQQPLLARWALWAHGAAALDSRDWRNADPWLGACLQLANNSENNADTLWVAESLASLAELSFKDGEYIDAINRATRGFYLWRQIHQTVHQLKTRSRDRSDDGFAALYVDGEISRMIEDRGGDWSAVRIHAHALREHSINMLLSCTGLALQSMSVSREIDPEFAADARALLDAEGDRVPRENRYKLYMSMGDAASLTGASQESLYWFERAVGCYYQNCMDENDLQRLVRALFNKGNSLARLGKYDEAIGIYRMIAGDFERFGDYEAEIRIDYAIAHARFLKGDRTGLEDELRRIIAEYHDLIKGAASSGRAQVNARNLPVVYALLLTVIASAPSSRERFLEALSITNRRYRESPHLIVERDLAVRQQKFSDWRSIQRVELLDALLRNDVDTTTLVFDSGADSLVLFAMRGETHDARCHVECLSQAFIEAVTELALAVEEENSRITEHRKTELDPVTEDIKRFGAAAWQSLPAVVQNWIGGTTHLQVVLSPFGSIDELPIDLLRSDDGWLGLTHRISRYNSLDELFDTHCGDHARRETKATALVDLAGTPASMGELGHAEEEAREVADYARLLGMNVSAPVTLDPEGMLEELKKGHHLLHYVGHGRATPLGERWMLTEDRWLPASWLKSLDPLTTPLVFLSACDLGQSRLAEDRDKGLVVEFLNAGAPAVIAATRPVSDRTSGEMVREIYAASEGGTPLSEAVLRARNAADCAGINPVCWSSFLVYGDSDATLQPVEHLNHETSWDGLLVRVAASDDNTYRLEARDALRSARLDPSTVEKLEAAIIQPLERLDEAIIAEVSSSNLIAGLRLRIVLSAFRIDAGLNVADKLNQDLLLSEVGTGLSLALRLNDDFGVVAMARRHCRLVTIVALHEVLRVLKHASNLASAMARQDSRFAKVATELQKESELYADKQIVDITKVMPNVQ